MAFQVGFNKEDLSGPPPVPTGVYELRLVKFRPKLSAKGNSLNYNAEFEVFNHPEYDGRRVFHPLNTLFAIAIWDYVHSCGLEVDNIKVTDEQTGMETEEFVLPGIFENANAAPDNPEAWGDYKGPLLNKGFRADVVETSYKGKPKNEIRAFLCAIPDCAEKHPDIKHSTNLIKQTK